MYSSLCRAFHSFRLPKSYAIEIMTVPQKFYSCYSKIKRFELGSLKQQMSISYCLAFWSFLRVLTKGQTLGKFDETQLEVSKPALSSRGRVP